MCIFTVHTYRKIFPIQSVLGGREGPLLCACCGVSEDPLSDILQAAYTQWSHAALFLLPYSGPLSGTELFSVEPVEFTEYLM